MKYMRLSVIALCLVAASARGDLCEDPKWPQQAQVIGTIIDVTKMGADFCIVTISDFRFIYQHATCPYEGPLSGLDKIDSVKERKSYGVNPTIKNVYYFPWKMALCAVGEEISGVLQYDGEDFKQMD